MEKKQQIIRFLIYFIILIPLMLFRDITPNNELKYLSIADEALRNGSIFAFFNHGIQYADKPPLYIWIVMLFKVILGKHSTFLLSLFSIIPAFITIGVFNRWCSKQMSKNYIIASELALLTSAYFLGSGLVLRMDMLMTMFITLAMYTFYRIYTGNNSIKLKILFPVYIFLAIFTKGPVGFLVPFICIPVFLIINKKIKTIGKYFGWQTWTILIILCGLWFWGVYLDGGGEYLNNLLFHQTIDRAVDSFHHKEPFYYYGIVIWYAIFPWSILVIGVIAISLFKKQKMSELTKFFICVGTTIIVMMSFFSAKIVIYILPCFGFLTYGAFLLLENSPYRKFAEKAPKVIINIAASLLLIIGISGLFIKKFNDRIGFKNVCEEAKIEAQKEKINRYGYCELRSGENMDVFLGQQLEKISSENLNEVKSIVGDSNGIIIFVKQEKKVIFKVLK
ncbi:MAG: glycosyltransferase family 39 protein [Bacteroidales bacterium]|nr:glycosyltransferase family 39 protein [Bacteroidales bacterium]